MPSASKYIFLIAVWEHAGPDVPLRGGEPCLAPLPYASEQLIH